MKRLIALMLSLMLCLSCLTTVSAAETVSAQALAGSLQDIHLFEGIGTGSDGKPDFALDKAMTRTEALVMLLRTLGVGDLAKTTPKTHPFSDVPAWADGYVSYAYDKGLTKGVSAQEFDADSSATAAVYLTFMLRALGYTEGETGDFSWDCPWFLANRCHILPFEVDTETFLREDAVLVTTAALYALPKGNTLPLWDALCKKNVFTQAEWNRTFQGTPFSAQQDIEAILETVLKERCGAGFSSLKNANATVGYRLVNVREGSDRLTYDFFVFLYDTYLNHDNTILSSGERQEGRLESVSLTVDANTHALLRATTMNDVRSRGLTDIVLLPSAFTYMGMPYPERLRYQDSIERIALAETAQKLKDGTISYTASAYSDALQTVLLNRSEVEAVFESDLGTVLLSWTHGTPHGSYRFLTFVAKSASPLGEGTVCSIPMPKTKFLYRNAEPKTMTLSNDGKAFVCTYYFKQDQSDTLISEDPVREAEAGTYTYTLDLQTGKVTITHDTTPPAAA